VSISSCDVVSTLTETLCTNCPYFEEECDVNLEQLDICASMVTGKIPIKLLYPIERVGLALTGQHIADACKVDKELADDVYRLIRGIDSTRQYENMWEDEPYINDYTREEQVLFIANILLGGHGVESIEGNYLDGYYQNVQLSYVNMGDTYSTTIIFDNLRQDFLLTSWGDIVENERRQRNLRIQFLLICESLV